MGDFSVDRCQVFENKGSIMVNSAARWGAYFLQLLPLVRIKPHSERIFTVSNCITFARILCVPFLVNAFLEKEWRIAFFIFLFASFTDFLDGYIARAMNETSVLGAILDPISDKIFLISLWTVLTISSPVYFIPEWFVWLVVLRELTILIGGGLMYWYKLDDFCAPTIWGKLTTATHIGFVFILFMSYFMGRPLVADYSILLAGVAIFTCFTWFSYLLRFFKALHEKP
jgi:cardiolipin synthase (CMP-forming)